jgi:hypothetical protein
MLGTFYLGLKAWYILSVAFSKRPDITRQAPVTIVGYIVPACILWLKGGKSKAVQYLSEKVGNI